MSRLKRLFEVSPAKFALGYFGFGVAWIAFSDRIVANVVESPATVTQIQTLKGWAFVTLSSAFVFALASVRERQILLWQNRLQTASEELQVLHRIFRHNISNDLMVIRGYVELVYDQLSNGHREHLAVAMKKTEGIIDMSEKLRVIDSTDLESTIEETTDLVSIIERECEDLEWGFSGVSIKTDLPTTAEVRGDEVIAYIVREAIENAIHHFDRDPEDCRIEIDVTRGFDATVVTIRDNGPGIPQNDLDAIRSGEERQTVHTSGVGLWLIKWLCRICGGAAEFVSDDGTDVVPRFQPANPLESITLESVSEPLTQEVQ